MRMVPTGIITSVVFEATLQSVALHLPLRIVEELKLNGGENLYGFFTTQKGSRNHFVLALDKPDGIETVKVKYLSSGKIRYYPKNLSEFTEISNCRPSASFYRCYEGDKMIGISVKMLYLKEVCTFCNSETGLCAFGGKYICVDCLNGIIEEFGKLKGNDQLKYKGNDD